MSNLKKFFLISLAYLLPVVAFAQNPLPNQSPSGGVGQSSSGGVGVSGNAPKLTNPLAGSVETIEAFVTAVLNNIVIPIGSVVVVIYIILTGYKFVTARGNEEKLADAKKSFYTVIIGAMIVLGAVAISLVIKNTVCDIAPNTSGCPDSNNRLLRN